jgi:hypothetical protein
LNSVIKKNVTTPIPYLWRYIRSGAIAGILSTLFFTIVHHFFIADIWFSFPVMAIAGAASGICIAWTFGLLFQKLTLSGWIRFNLFFIAMFALLGILSVIIFEPVATITA